MDVLYIADLQGERQNENHQILNNLQDLVLAALGACGREGDVSIKEVDDQLISRQCNTFDCGPLVAAYSLITANEWSLRSLHHSDTEAMRWKILINICSKSQSLEPYITFRNVPVVYFATLVVSNAVFRGWGQS